MSALKVPPIFELWHQVFPDVQDYVCASLITTRLMMMACPEPPVRRVGGR